MIRRGVPRWGALLVCLLSLAAAGGSLAQEEVDLGEATLQSSRTLEEASSLYAQAEFGQAIQLLDQLLAEFELRPVGTLPVEEESLRSEALRLRGLAFANLGQMDAARRDFATLLRQDPAAALDSQLVSPKILAMFEEVRGEVTGSLVVRSEPPGAEVRLGRTVLGVTPLEPTRLASGRYLLQLERRGFAPIQESVELEPGRTTEIDRILERDARSVSVITVPSGVRISVDGEPVGTTSGTPPAGFDVVLMEKGIDPADASAPLTVPFLSAGQHVVRAERECYAPVEAFFEVTLDNADLPLELEPLVLEATRAGLSLDSEPQGATVTIDGRPVGRTPVTVDDLCGQSVRVHMELPGVGRWDENVALVSGRVQTVTAELRLSLASLGAVREVGVPSREADTWERALLDVMTRQKHYRPVRGPSSPDEIGPAQLEVYRHLQVSGAESRVALEGGLRRRLSDELGADLFMVAVPGGEARGEVLLYGLYQGRPDVVEADLEGGGVELLVEMLERPGLRMASWSGVVAVETAESDFPLAVEVLSGERDGGGVRPGDRIRAVAGRPVVGRRELAAAFAGREPGSIVSVSVERGGTLESVQVSVAETPVLPRPGEQGGLLNKSIADLERLRRIADTPRARSLAALAVGMAYLMAGDPSSALEEGFEQARLDPGAGVSAGTVDFLMGAALEALGPERAAEARESYERAAKEPEATLWRDDGPLVAPLAKARTGAPR